MHKFLNFFCFPLLITGFILLSSGILGYNSYDINVHTNTKTSAQINKLYSEKEILLKDPPVSETLSEKLVVKVRKKPINPEILTNIGQNKDINIISYLSDNDFDHLNNEKKEFVKTVLPIIINENQKIIMSRDFITNLKTKLEKFKTLNKKEITKLNKIADSYNNGSVFGLCYNTIWQSGYTGSIDFIVLLFEEKCGVSTTTRSNLRTMCLPLFTNLSFYFFPSGI